jgi:UDP-N-acetylmuramoyl-tripeptide--D-alanyl-D-alanine ligase
MHQMKDAILKIIVTVLKNSAARVLKNNRPVVIGITGTVGKTSTKEAILSVMRKKYGSEVAATSGNLNTEIGAPLTILGYKKQPSILFWPISLLSIFIKSLYYKCPRYLILELAVDKPGDMDYFGSFIELDVAVITATTPVHLANFTNFEQLREEKCKIVNLLKTDGKTVVNIDEVEGRGIEKGALRYSIKQEADTSASELATSTNGNEYKLNILNKSVKINSKLIGYQMVYAQLAAASVGSIFKVDEVRIKEALEAQKPLPGRMNVLNGNNEVTIIDDTYNASPASVKAALDVLSVADCKRRVAILGNMNELGTSEERAHKEIGKYAKGKTDLAIFIGKNAKMMALGFDDVDNSIIFDTRHEAEKKLDAILKSGDCVLVKASQNGNYFEETVKKLMKNPSESAKVLVRQSKYWLNKKNKS